MDRLAYRWIVASALVVLGCNSDVEPSPSGDGESSSGGEPLTTLSSTEWGGEDGFLSSGGGPPDPTDGASSACECIVDEPHGPVSSAEPMLPTCGELLCDPIEITGCADDQVCDAGPVVIENPEAMRCALLALRDRTPGLIVWQSDSVRGPMTGYHLILDDETVISRNWGLHYGVYFATAATRRAAVHQFHYADCMAQEDPQQQVFCMAGGEAEIEEVCDEGWARDEVDRP